MLAEAAGPDQGVELLATSHMILQRQSKKIKDRGKTFEFKKGGTACCL